MRVKETNQTELLLTLAFKDEIFSSFENLDLSDAQIRVFINTQSHLTQKQIADKSDVTQPSVSKSHDKLESIGLLKETDKGYGKTLSIFGHPIIKFFWMKRVKENEQ